MRHLVLALGVLLLGAPPAAAHAFLDHAEPRVGSTVDASPSTVTLFFTEPVEPAFSRVEVDDGDGKKLATEAVRHPAPDRLELPLPALPAGEYTVHWAVVSVDTHPTEGRFTFSVRAAGR
jgi:methionine-rich copper-binding protein CopC